MNRLLLIALCVLAPHGLLAQSWQLYTTPSKPAVFLITDSALWVGSDGVVQMDPESGEILGSFQKRNSGLLFDDITSIQEGPNGSLWIGHRIGVSIKSGSRWYSGEIKGVRGPKSAVPVTDSSGWVISGSNFLWWFDGSQMTDSIGTQLSTLGGDTYSATLTNDGTLWVATDSGLVQRQGTFMNLLRWRDIPPGRRSPSTTLHATPNGGFWVLSTFGVENFYYFHPVTGWISYPAPQDYSHISVDPSGQIWIGNNFSVFKWEPYAVPFEKKRASVLITGIDRFYVDRKGRVWSSTEMLSQAQGAVVRNDPDGTITLFSPEENGLWSAFPGAIAVDQNDQVYLTYREDGPLTRFSPDEDTWEHFLFHPTMIPSSWQWSNVDVAPDGTVWTTSDYNDFNRTDTELEGFQSFDPQTNTWQIHPEFGLRNSFTRPLFVLSPNGFIASVSRPITEFRNGVWSRVPSSTGDDFEEQTLPAWDNKDRLLALIGGPETLGTYEPASGWTTISLPETPQNDWNQLLIDGKNTRWLVSSRGILQVFDDFAGKLGFSTRWISPDSLGLGAEEKLLMAAFDRHDALWFFTDRERLVRLHCDGTIAFTIPNDIRPVSRWRLSDIEIDSKGRVYLSVYRQGLYVFDPGNLSADSCPDNTPFLSEEWIVYPNPATDRVTLSHGNPQAGELTYRWFDLSGRVVMEERAE